MSSSEDEYRPGGKNRAVKSKKNSKPSKPAKDPNKPKAPLSSYMRFVNEKRNDIKADNPGAGIGEIAKIAGKMWKELDEDDKKAYEKAYQKERKIYLEKMEDYVPPPGCKPVKSKPVKDPNAPKKPLTAYFAWMNENRARIKEENPDAGLGEISKIAGREWKEVDEDERAELDANYKKGMEEYKKLMANYVPGKAANGKKAAKKAPAKRKGGKAKSSEQIYDDSSDGGDGASTSSLSDDATDRKKARHADSDSD